MQCNGMRLPSPLCHHQSPSRVACDSIPVKDPACSGVAVLQHASITYTVNLSCMSAAEVNARACSALCVHMLGFSLHQKLQDACSYLCSLQPDVTELPNDTLSCVSIIRTSHDDNVLDATRPLNTHTRMSMRMGIYRMTA